MPKVRTSDKIKIGIGVAVGATIITAIVVSTLSSGNGKEKSSNTTKTTISETVTVSNTVTDDFNIESSSSTNDDFESMNYILSFDLVPVTKKSETTTTTKKSEVTTKKETTTKKYTTTKANKVYLSRITLSKSSISLKVGQSASISANKYPSGATNKNVSWSSSSSSVVSVSGGKIYAKKAGSAVVYCKAVDGSGTVASCRVTVTKPTVKVTSISLNSHSAVLYVGNSYHLSVTCYPSNATNKSVSWSSSNSSVVSVSNGTVVAKGAGRAVVTCKSNDGSGKIAECVFVVYKDE